MSATLSETPSAIDRDPCPPALPPSGRLGPGWLNALKAAAGPPWQRRLARAALYVPAIRHFEQQFGKLSDADLKREALRLRGRVRAGSALRRLIPEAFGISSVAIWRALGMRPFDVQLAAGVVMHEGALVELATGEGKTLTAALPTFLNGLSGKGVHVTTVNDYLAKRDADLLAPAYERLGLSVGVLQMKMEDNERTRAYRSDITYGTASEFGFDFLRDRLKIRGGQATASPFWSAWTHEHGPGKSDPRVQRELHYAIVDEADSIFIDEARTPLIISSPTRPATPEESVVYTWADGVARQMQPQVHFRIDIKKDKIELTEAGAQLMRYSNPPFGAHSKAMDKLQEALEKAIHAHFRFVLDHHYMIIKDKIVIVDENTGRPMPDRHWREGLHQAVEAKEKVQITYASEHAAQITFQAYFRQYKKLAGMSGTVVQNFWELRRVYRIWVVCVPTNRPVIREHWPDAVYPTEDAKFDAVVASIRDLQQRGRPVLVGTRSVEKSEILSERLKAAGVEHQVLNAKQNEQEAMIVAQAGLPGRVTVATNMAGRGTDIKLGGAIDFEERDILQDGNIPEEEKARRVRELRARWQELHNQVVAAGGLHVIGTERHEAKRIDRQLLGRSGRQGDPGSGQFFVSLEDQLLEALGHARQESLEALGQRGGNRDWNGFRGLFVKAQRKTERKHYRQRLDLMYYDKQRKEMLQDLGADPFVD